MSKLFEEGTFDYVKLPNSQMLPLLYLSFITLNDLHQQANGPAHCY